MTGRYYIDRGLLSTDIYILEYRTPSRITGKMDKTKGIELSDKELKELILKEKADGKEVKLLWKPVRRGARKSHFQIDIETRRYNRVMNCDNQDN